MSFEIEYRTAEAQRIIDIFKAHPELSHLLPGVQYIGKHEDSQRALEFLEERVRYHEITWE